MGLGFFASQAFSAFLSYALLMNVTAYLCFLPFRFSLRISSRRIIFLILFVNFLSAGIQAVLGTLIPSLGYHIFLYIYMVTHLFLFLFLVKEAWRKKLFVFFIALGMGVVLCCLVNFMDAWLFPEHYSEITFNTLGLLFLLYCVALPPLSVYMRYDISPMLYEVKDPFLWRYLWLIPATFTITLIFLIAPSSLETARTLQYVAVPIILGIGGLITHHMLSKPPLLSARSAVLEQEIGKREYQLGIQAEQYQRLSGQIAQTRAARHDLRHHLSILLSLMEDGEVEKARNYLSTYATALDSISDIPLCGNYVVDAVVQHYLGQARERGIQVDVQLDIPEDCGVEDTDLCIVLGNCLENALEACARMEKGAKCIRLRAQKVGQMLVITLDNSYDGVQKGRHDQFFSTKRKGREPGMGLSSIRAVAEKYNGVAQFHGEEGVFQSSILLLPGEKAQAPEGETGIILSKGTPRIMRLFRRNKG